MAKPKMLRVRCKACQGHGVDRYHVRDDSTVSGYRYLERPCEHCASGVVLKPMPRKSKLGAGIHTAKLLMPCGASAHGDRYNHPSIQLRTAPSEGYEHGRIIFELSFQRHRLESADDLRYSRAVDPRFDVGPVAWSAAYGGRIGERDRGFDLDHPSTLKLAAQVCGKIEAARRELPGEKPCDLGATCDALELLGVSLDLVYYTPGNELSFRTPEELRHEIAEGRIPIGRAKAEIDGYAEAQRRLEGAA